MGFAAHAYCCHRGPGLAKKPEEAFTYSDPPVAPFLFPQRSICSRPDNGANAAVKAGCIGFFIRVMRTFSDDADVQQARALLSEQSQQQRLLR